MEKIPILSFYSPRDPSDARFGFSVKFWYCQYLFHGFSLRKMVIGEKTVVLANQKFVSALRVDQGPTFKETYFQGGFATSVTRPTFRETYFWRTYFQGEECNVSSCCKNYNASNSAALPAVIVEGDLLETLPRPDVIPTLQDFPPKKMKKTLKK